MNTDTDIRYTEDSKLYEAPTLGVTSTCSTDSCDTDFSFNRNVTVTCNSFDEEFNQSIENKKKLEELKNRHKQKWKNKEKRKLPKWAKK